MLAALHLRNPASRLLADLAAAAPPGVTFTDVQLTRRPAPPRPRDAPEVTGSPAARDAADLARRRRGEHAEVRVGGTAPTDAAVAGLLSSAAAGGDFDAVELLFTDRGDGSAPGPRPGRGADGGRPSAGARVFSARLTARPAAAAD